MAPMKRPIAVARWLYIGATSSEVTPGHSCVKFSSFLFAAFTAFG